MTYKFPPITDISTYLYIYNALNSKNPSLSGIFLLLTNTNSNFVQASTMSVSEFRTLLKNDNLYNKHLFSKYSYLLSRPENNLIFPDKHNKPYTLANFRRYLDSIKESLSLKCLNISMLRKTYLYSVYEDTHDISLLLKLSGRKSEKELNEYLYINNHSHQPDYSNIQAIIETSSSPKDLGLENLNQITAYIELLKKQNNKICSEKKCQDYIELLFDIRATLYEFIENHSLQQT